MRHVAVVALGALLVAASAGATPRTLKLRFPRLTVPPASNVETCFFIRLPLRDRFDVVRYGVRHHGLQDGLGLLHSLVYVYQGSRLGGFADTAGRIVTSRGCQDVGPPDRTDRQLVNFGGVIPPGVALPLEPVPDQPGGPPAGIGILLDWEWVNGDARPHSGSSVVILQRAARGSVRRLMSPILARTAERALAVPPGVLASTETSTAAVPAAPDAWGPGLPTDGAPAPPGPACVTVVSGHMRKRGTLLAVDHQLADGTISNPPGGPKNPYDQRVHLFAAPDFTDPGTLTFPSPLRLGAGEALRYACWHDNGTRTAPRQGCEEAPGVTPGRPGAPAKPCRVAGDDAPDCPASDPAYAGRSFTGACVEANLVAGPTSDDEDCALSGYYYDAAPDGGCDVSGLPPIE